MISVSGVSMRFGSKVLFEDVTTTFSSARRYGLTGPNGAGKSTFMKLLTGDQPPQRGSITRPPKLGVLRQDHYAFDTFRVIDTVIMGNQRLWNALQERDVLYTRTDISNQDGMRLGELEGIVGEEDGYTAESDAAILLQGLDIPNALHEKTMAELQGGQKVRVLLAQALFGHPAALLLDEPTKPPGPGLDPLARGVSQPLRRHGDRDLARPPLPEQRLYAHRRHRLRDDHHVYRWLRRHGPRQDTGARDHRGAERTAREKDRAAE
jgi:ABC-type cobalamin/Fe3+-siderophores transport system ATPase subunit